MKYQTTITTLFYDLEKGHHVGQGHTSVIALVTLDTGISLFSYSSQRQQQLQYHKIWTWFL